MLRKSRFEGDLKADQLPQLLAPGGIAGMGTAPLPFQTKKERSLDAPGAWNAAWDALSEGTPFSSLPGPGISTCKSKRERGTLGKASQDTGGWRPCPSRG